MSTLVQLVTRSLETGSIFALAALGIIIIFRTSSITHFAQGAMAMFNTFVVTILFSVYKMPLWMAVIGGIISAFTTGFLVDFLIIRHTKKVSPVAKQIMTLGLIMVFVGVIPMFFGVEPLNLPKFINNGEVLFLGARISYNGIFNISLGLVIMFVLFYILQNTKWGLAVRTTASNEVVARMMGVPTKKVTMAAWAIAAGLGVIAGVMNAPTTTVTPNLMDSVQLNALVACVLGGFQTFYGPVIGAYIIAIAQNLFAYYISSTWATQLLYISILVFIVFRPHGLIGKKVIKKV